MEIPSVRTIEEFAETATPGEPAATGISIRLQQRIRDLEETLRDERRALTEAEQRYAELDGKYQELAQREPT